MLGVGEFKLSKIFEIKLGDGKYTKRWCHDHPGEYPVYSGSSLGVYEHVDCYDYDEDCITWTKDGLAGYVTEHRGEKFCITNHCGIMIVKPEYKDKVDLSFMKYVIQEAFRRERAGRLAAGEKDEYTTFNKTMAKNVIVNVPVKNDGVTPDIARQREYAAKMDDLNRFGARLRKLRESIELTEVDISEQVRMGSFAEKRIDEVFQVKRGSAYYTQTYMHDHPGDYPVYTARNGAAAGKMDRYDYDGDYVTVSLNGFAGVVTITSGKFSCTADRAVLVPCDGIELDLTFIKAITEPLFRLKRHGRIGQGESNEFTKLGSRELEAIRIPIPINTNGEPDIDAQREFSLQYSRMVDMKKKTIAEINALLSMGIEFGM